MKKFLKIMGMILAVFIVASGITLFCTPYGRNLRLEAAAMILSSQHPQYAKYTFLPQKDLNNILNNIEHPKYENTDLTKLFSIKTRPKKAPSHTNTTPAPNPVPDGLVVRVDSIEKFYSPTYFYKGEVIEISDPKAVQLVSSSLKNFGEQIFVLASRVHALAAINASGFYDPNGVGNGGTATGIVIENGVVKRGGDPNFVAGITNDGQMVTGKYSADDLLRLGVKYAAGFTPQLISNGQKMVQGDGGWGIGPRTAIGQKKDGTIVMVEIDGRQPTRSLGATIEEVQNILYDRGVINAICMDGGSSSSVYFNGKNITIPSSVGHVPRYLPNIWAVIPPKGEPLTVYQDGQKLDNSQLNY